MNLQSIINFFKGSKIVNLGKGLVSLEPFFDHLEQNYQTDKNAKNALIDSVIEVLQAHKEI